MKYEFAAIEPKWQKRWEEAKVYAVLHADDLHMVHDDGKNGQGT